MRYPLGTCLLSCLLLSLPAAALAQERGGQVAAEHKKTVEKAQALVNKAVSGMTRYAERSAPKALEPEDALKQAIKRLNGPIEPPVEKPRQLDPGQDPIEAFELLDTFRAVLLKRLRRLAPNRHPLPTEPKRAPFGMTLYDVQALLDPVEDHRGANVGLGSGLDSSGERELLSVEETAGSGLDPDQLEMIVTSAVGEDLWDDPASIEIERGRLIVVQTAQVHAKIAKLLDDLGPTKNDLVELELRVYRMPASLFKTLGPGSTSLSDADEKQLETAVAQKQLTLLAAHRVIAHDGQRVSVQRGSARSIVAAIGVDQTGVVPVIHPVVNSLNLGQVIEVRPTIDRESKRVLLDVALSLCELAEPIDAVTIDGNELDLPRLKIARTSSTALVPLGRGALLGGMFSQGGGDDALSTVIYVRAHLIQGR